MDTLRIDVWSDIACPWCYVGKRRLESALARFPHRDAVAVVWRSFELDPSAPHVSDASVGYAARLAKKYGASVAEAEGMIARMTATGADDGLELRFDRVRPANMFDAHRVLHLARERGRQDAVKERFLRAYMTEGASMGEPETLARLGEEAGLDADEIRRALQSDAYAADVRADEGDAAEAGIRGVPAFVLAGKYLVSGAQPADLLLRALTQAWNELPPSDDRPAIACGPDGCPLPSA